MSTNPAPLSDAAGPTAERSLIARRRGGTRWLFSALIAAALVGLGFVLLRGPSAGAVDDAVSDGSVFVVKSGPLVASITESGTLRSSQAVVVKNELEGTSTILSIAPEGTTVKAGDLLVELDASTLADKLIDQEIEFQGSEATFVQARENLEIVRKQAEADVSTAKVELELAELDLQKYMEGESRQLTQEARTKITIADAELKRAADKLEWSQKLAAEGYITNTELQADQLSKQKAELELDLARGELDLMERFTHKRKLAELRSAVDTSRFALAKAEHKAQSNIVEAEAKLRAQDVSLKREQSKLDKLKDQIAKAKLYAPVDGMVVYAHDNDRWGGGNEPLKEGSSVRERQSLISLPTTSGMVADIKIHEAALDKVRTGLPVRVTVDALPDRVFNGHIEKIAVLPDSQDRWRNPDLTVFNSEVKIVDDTTDLRPGMSCRAEVIIDEFDDTVFVPIQSVLRINGQPTVYVKSASGASPVPVTVGLDNNRMIRIIDGLTAGQRVLLDPPMPPSVRRDTSAGAAERPAPPGDRPATPPQPPAASSGDQPGPAGGDRPANGEARPRRPRPVESSERAAPAAPKPATAP